MDLWLSIIIRNFLEHMKSLKVEIIIIISIISPDHVSFWEFFLLVEYCSMQEYLL